MEIRGYGQLQRWSTPPAMSTMKVGDVYEVVVKEKVSDREAIVQLRGVDVRFRFDGDVPKDGRLTVQITGQQGEIIEGRVVVTQPTIAPPSFETPELRQAAQIIAAKQLPLTNELVASLRTFLTEGTGTVEQKLETIQVAASKKLEMTVSQLTAIHEALHGQSLSASLGEIVQAIDANFSFTRTTEERSLSLSELRIQVQQEPIFARAVEHVKRYAEETGDTSLGNAVQEAIRFKETNEPLARSRLLQALMERKESPINEQAPASEALRLVRRQVEREPIVAKALSIVKANESVRQLLGKTFDEIEELYRSGQPLSAKTKLLQALAEAEQPPESKAAPKATMSLEQAVMEAKQIVRSACHVEEAVQQLKETVLPNVRGGSGLEEVVSRIEQTIQQAKEQFVKAVQAPPQQTAIESAENVQTAPRSEAQQLIISRVQQGTLSLLEAMEQLDSSTENSVFQQFKQALYTQQEQLSTALSELDGQVRPLSAIVAQAVKAVQREANIQVVFETMETETIPALHRHPNAQQTITKAVETAKQLVEDGREMAARQAVLHALHQVEQTLPASAPAIEWQASFQLPTKDIMVQTVTKRMAEATHHFRQVKRDMMRNLSATDQLIAQFKQAARPQANQLLETVIKQLDQTILKSDVMLFADMTLEKRLLQASSQLAQAKQLLDKGQISDAQKIVKQVKNVLEQLQFKPADTKVKHFIASETHDTPEKTLLSEWNRIVQPEPSARHVFDTIRRMGMMYEAEVANALVLGEGRQEEAEATLKGWLTKLAQTGNDAVAKQAEQAATHLTGQQLLNKGDQGSAMQTLFFTLPLLLQKEVKDVKVYVNARNDGKRIDWENCSLYFLLETNKLGDVGVLLSANERTLSVTFRNNREGFAEKMRPLVEAATEKLEAIGYRIGNVQFTTFAEPEKTAAKPEEKRATWTEKGYDFTI
nr:hypothetical protein [Anoxybacillus sp.]